MSTNAEQIASWSGAVGDTWVAMQERLDRQLQTLGTRAMQALALQPGARVADIGCGSGQATLELAQRVGPSGRVVGVDVSAALLAVARVRASLPQVTFVEADAQQHDFGAPLDAMFSRFGVMFFADPVVAFTHLHAALKPRGKIAFVCWRGRKDNPIMTAPFDAAMTVLPAPAPTTLDPFAPGPFAFADGDRLRQILAGAGFVDVTLTAHDEAIGGNDADATLQMALRVGPLGALLREHPQHKDAVVEVVRKALVPYTTAHGVFMPSATWIVSAAA